MSDIENAALRQQFGEMIGRLESLQSEMAAMRKDLNDMKEKVYAGSGAVRALVWIGGTIIAIGTLVIATLNYLKH